MSYNFSTYKAYNCCTVILHLLIWYVQYCCPENNLVPILSLNQKTKRHANKTFKQETRVSIIIFVEEV